MPDVKMSMPEAGESEGRGIPNLIAYFLCSLQTLSLDPVSPRLLSRSPSVVKDPGKSFDVA